MTMWSGWKLFHLALAMEIVINGKRTCRAKISLKYGQRQRIDVKSNGKKQIIIQQHECVPVSIEWIYNFLVRYTRTPDSNKHLPHTNRDRIDYSLYISISILSKWTIVNWSFWKFQLKKKNPACPLTLSLKIASECPNAMTLREQNLDPFQYKVGKMVFNLIAVFANMESERCKVQYKV